jgi:hypothetical protein
MQTTTTNPCRGATAAVFHAAGALAPADPGRAYENG